MIYLTWAPPNAGILNIPQPTSPPGIGSLLALASLAHHVLTTVPNHPQEQMGFSVVSSLGTWGHPMEWKPHRKPHRKPPRPAKGIQVTLLVASAAVVTRSMALSLVATVATTGATGGSAAFLTN